MIYAGGVLLWLAIVLRAGHVSAEDESNEGLSVGVKWHLQQARQLIRATDFEQAWQHLEIASETCLEEDEDAIDSCIDSHIITADFYANSGGGEQIYQTLDKARALARQHQRPLAEAAILKQSSQFLAGDGDFSAAWAALEDARGLYRQHEQHDRLLELEAFASLLASRQGKHEQAARLAATAIAGLSAAGNERMTMNALSVLAYSQERLGRDQLAMATYQELIPKAWALNDQLQLNSAYCNLAQVKRRLGMSHLAEDDLRRTIEALDQARSRLPRTPQERSSFVEEQILAFSRLAELLVDNYRASEALDVLEQFRAQAFFDNLALVEVSHQADLPATIRQQEQNLLKALADARLTHARLSEQSKKSAEVAPVADLEARIQTLRAAYWRRHGLPEEPLASFQIEHIQGLLEEDEALINYWQLPERVLAWVITAEGVDFTNIPVGAADIQHAMNEYLAPLKWPWLARDQALSGMEDRHIAQGRQLYRWLAASLPASASRKPRWIIVADAGMNLLPWSALISACDTSSPINGQTVAGPIHQRYAQCHYLIEQYSLRYSSSLSAFQHLRQRAQEKKPASVELDSVHNLSVLSMAPTFGESAQPQLPALPAAEREARRVSQLFEHQTVLTGPAANESLFKQQAAEFGVLHLATHGLMQDAYPLSSGVLLAAHDQDDGLLQAHEVLSLKLNARLVTLAACRSASGRISRAEGLVGLSQAFLYAGADAVLANLLDLQDEDSSILVEAFYQKRQSGLADDIALQQAMLQVLNGHADRVLVTHGVATALAHPRFWAGYRLIGAP